MTLPVLRTRADQVSLVDPQTGEVINATEATTDKLAEIRDELRTYDETARIAKKTIDNELLGRMDLEGRWSVRVGRFHLSAPSPAPERIYDAEALHEALSVLVDEGKISAQALMDAVAVEQVFKPQKSGINRLLKLGGDVEGAIRSCMTEVPRDRRVTVKGSGS